MAAADVLNKIHQGNSINAPPSQQPIPSHHLSFRQLLIPINLQINQSFIIFKSFRKWIKTCHNGRMMTASFDDCPLFSWRQRTTFFIEKRRKMLHFHTTLNRFRIHRLTKWAHVQNKHFFDQFLSILIEKRRKMLHFHIMFIRFRIRRLTKWAHVQNKQFFIVKRQKMFHFHTVLNRFRIRRLKKMTPCWKLTFLQPFFTFMGSRAFPARWGGFQYSPHSLAPNSIRSNYTDRSTTNKFNSLNRCSTWKHIRVFIFHVHQL